MERKGRGRDELETGLVIEEKCGTMTRRMIF